MANAQNLLGLLGQLQSMESSFVAILMETASKLSSLTDTNIFLLVETQQGRRFTGDRRLCDAFLGQGIRAFNSDVEYAVDPSVVALHPRAPAQGVPVAAHQSPIVDSSNGSVNTAVESIVSRKRRILPAPTSTESLTFSPTTPKQSRTSEVTEIKLEDDSFKNEPHSGIEPAAIREEIVLDGDDFGVESMQDSQGLSQGQGLPNLPPLTDSDWGQDQQNGLAPSQNSLIHQQVSLESYQAYVPFELPDDFLRKMEALQTFTTPVLFDKNSMEYRLFTSCVYQLGGLVAKSLVANTALHARPTDVEDFFLSQVGLWMSNFPYLVQSDTNGIRVDNSLTVGSFIKHRARNAFRKACSAAMKRYDVSIALPEDKRAPRSSSDEWLVGGALMS